MMDKLNLINSGDIVEWRAEGQTLRGEVHGWKFDIYHASGHYALVGSEYHEREIALRNITARERKKGAGSGTITF